MDGGQLNAFIVWAASLILILAILAYAAMSFPWLLAASYRILRDVLAGDPGGAMVLLTGVFLTYMISTVLFQVDAFSFLFQINPEALRGIADAAAERAVGIFQEILRNMPGMEQ